MRRRLRLDHWRAGQRGAFAVITAAVVGLIAFATTAALDVTRLNMLERTLEHAADQAALASARTQEEHAAAAKGIFELSTADNRHRFAALEHWHRIEGEEHIVSARGKMKSLMLGLVGLGVIDIVAESVALAEQVRTMMPCLSLKATSGTSLRLGTSAEIGGEGCILVLEHDDPAQVEIAEGAVLSMEGFCVRRKGRPRQLGALSDLLGLPLMQGVCDNIPEINPDFGVLACDFPSFDQHTSVNEIVSGRLSYKGGVYCGPVLVDRKDASHSFDADLIEAVDGDLTKDVDWLRYHDQVFVSNQAIVLRVQEDSYINAPLSGPYAGYTIVQRSGGAGGAIELDDQISINGLVYAPNGDITVTSGAGETATVEPILSRSFIMLPGTDIAIQTGAGTGEAATVSVTRPRLVR